MIRVQDKLLTMSMLKTRGLVVVSVGEEAVALLVGAVEVEVGLEPARVTGRGPRRRSACSRRRGRRRRG